MSLEQALADNTAAMTKLIEVWTTLTAQAKTIDGTKPFKAAGVPVTKVEAPKPEPTPAPTPVAAAEATTALPATAAASPSEAPAVVEMKDLSAAVTAAATRNRDGLVALLGKHNVKRASELPQGKWASLVAELEAL